MVLKVLRGAPPNEADGAEQKAITRFGISSKNRKKVFILQTLPF